MKEELRNKVNYDNLSEFSKFMHAYKFTIKQFGLKGIISYPLAYWKLKKMVNEKDNKKTG